MPPSATHPNSTCHDRPTLAKLEFFGDEAVTPQAAELSAAQTFNLPTPALFEPCPESFGVQAASLNNGNAAERLRGVSPPAEKLRPRVVQDVKPAPILAQCRQVDAGMDDSFRRSRVGEDRA